MAQFLHTHVMKSSRAKRSANSATRNAVRIIAGRWRGRRITFPDSAGLRPTPDRVRETVFNWLQPAISQTRCLDLFAGSGALGFEALSRGAASALFVERERPIWQQLRSTGEMLGALHAEFQCADALDWLRRAPVRQFDIVFVDPPFASGAWQVACDLVAERGWLATSAYVYLEAPADLPLSFLPSAWQVIRSKHAGQVGYHLARVSQTTGPA